MYCLNEIPTLIYVQNDMMVSEALKAYLPGAGGTVIMKAVPPGRDPSIALRLG